MADSSWVGRGLGLTQIEAAATRGYEGAKRDPQVNGNWEVGVAAAHGRVRVVGGPSKSVGTIHQSRGGRRLTGDQEKLEKSGFG
ncbi:hypothetical protein CRG98_012382 [Punica granatum]|uniref:Uncharacterized protein n=1 Tax=Punica granatum TaxID=22663 RepID=A0A2I0KFF3_PUNGR|nr:hypothetical protein CRG98_012382 [Punica granatum]